MVENSVQSKELLIRATLDGHISKGVWVYLTGYIGLVRSFLLLTRLKIKPSKMSQNLICSSCGHIGESKLKAKGSMAVEIVLWLCFLIPGLIYSVWRISSKQNICSKCGSSTLIPVDTPVGRKILSDQGKNIEEFLPKEKPDPRFSKKTIVIIFILLFFLSILIASF